MKSFPLSLALAVLSLSACQTGGGLGRYDLDRDGFLNYQEFSAAATGQGTRDPGAAFIAADTDRDGALSAAEFQAYSAAQSTR